VPAREAPKGGPPGEPFEATLQERLAQRAPLAARMRPRTLDEIVGQSHCWGRARRCER
jgi:putative ATPase